MTSIPSRSHASSIAGLIGLWALRSALKPAALRISTRRSSARAKVAAPITPLSWWMHAPRRLTVSPLMRRPRSASSDSERMPNVVAASSSDSPSRDAERRAARVEVRLIDAPPLRRRDRHALPHDAPRCPARPERARRRARPRRRTRRRARSRRRRSSSRAESFTTVDSTTTTARSSSMSGVVTRRPSSAR